jgi:polyhydroxybutyrate depolymerase
MRMAGVTLLATLAALAILAGGCSRLQDQDAAGDRQTSTLLVGDIERSYSIHAPESAGGRLGLIIALHGGSSTPERFAEITGFDRPAARDGAVAYPAGIGRTWNAGDCCGRAQRRQVDDVAFMRALIRDVAARIPLDRRRVFATGWSNGGKMAYRLACALADQIASIGVVGTGLGVDDCKPSETVSLLHIHGTADRLHPYQGGDGLFSDDQAGAEQSVATWRRLNGCSDASSTYRTDATTCERWSRCSGDEEVRLCTIEGMGHQWPPREVRPTRLLGPTTDDYNATAAILSFFHRSEP